MFEAAEKDRPRIEKLRFHLILIKSGSVLFIRTDSLTNLLTSFVAQRRSACGPPVFHVSPDSHRILMSFPAVVVVSALQSQYQDHHQSHNQESRHDSD
jgi:hypothetical protein